jgi:anti-anti-sigma factor
VRDDRSAAYPVFRLQGRSRPTRARLLALWKEFTLTTASPLQLHDVRMPSADEVQQTGRAVFTAEELADGRMLIGVRGDVDATNRQSLGRFVARHTRVSKQLILDLTSVDFFGSQGFTALYYVSVQCARRDVDWMIAGSRTVQRILQICDPDGELPLIADLEAALARLDHVAKCRHAVAWGDAYN